MKRYGTDDDKPAGNDGPMVGGRNQNDYPAAERPCFAHGCPELGTITDAVQRSRTATWFCRHHDAERSHPERWGEVSRKLRLRDPQSEPDPAGRYAGWSPAACKSEIKRILSQSKPGKVAGTWTHLGGRGPDDDPKEWARVLRVKHQAGEPLNPAQIDAYKAALGLP